MRISNLTTDDAILLELGARLARARLRLNLTQAQLAETAGVSKRTLERLEAGQVGTQLSGFLRVCRALGILEQIEAFIPEPTPSPMEQLRLSGRVRKRASGDRMQKVGEDPGEWTWGDEK